MSYVRFRFHVVTAVKHRAPLLTAIVEPILHRVLAHNTKQQGGRLLAAGGIEDHIHLVVALPQTVYFPGYLRTIKTSTTHAINRSDLLEEPFGWQNGYGAFTLDAWDIDRVVRYMLNQRAHHERGRLWAPFERVD